MVSANTGGDTVYEQVLDELSSGNYPAGSRILEKELSERLGVSRIPLREALSKMLGQGLLCSNGQYRGIWLRAYDAGEICRMYEFRSILESGAAALTAQYVDTAGVLQLELLLGTLEKMMDDGRFGAPEWSALDRQFHQTFVGLCHNPRLIEAVRSLLLESRFMFYQNPKVHQLYRDGDAAVLGHVEKIRRSHRDIFEAVAAHDPAEAEAAVRRHFREGAENTVYAITVSQLAQNDRREEEV